MRYIDLPVPHGFLIWRGKQTAIAMHRPIQADKILIVSNGEAFGEATLSQPIAVNIKEFDRRLEAHCIKELERKLWWPDATAFYIHDIKEFDRFEEPILFENGEMVDYQPTEQEQALINQASELPKELCIDDSAVIISGDGQHIISDKVKDYLHITKVLEAGITTNGDDNELAVYKLALVRNPRLVVKKKETPLTTDDLTEVADTNQLEEVTMPYAIAEEGFGDCEQIAVVKVETEEVVGCHETTADAEAQLAALAIAEEEMMAEDEIKQEGGELLQERLENIRGAFNGEFNQDDRWFNYLIDATDTYAIAEMEGVKYRIPFQETEEGIIFAARDTWARVKVNYTEKAGKRINSGMLKRLKDAWKTLKELLSWAEYQGEDKEFGIAIKEVDGKPWHFMWSTNAFRDREREIFSTKALDAFANEVNQKEEKGFFNFWHIPGTDFARKEFIETVGRFLIEAGPYLDDEKGQAALKFFKEYKDGHPDFAPEGWGGSPEFRFNLEDRDDGVYDWLWIDRTSTLPRAAAANVYTQSGQQEVKMSTLEGQRKEAAVALFGEGFINDLLKEGEKRTTTLEEAGVAHKDKQPEAVDLEAIVAKALEKQISVDLTSVTDVVTELAESLKAQSNEIEALKKALKIKEESETPRYVLQLSKRASEAQATELPEGDALKDRKPVETPADKSMAGHFFGRQ